MRLQLALLSMLALFAFACSGDGKEEASTEAETTDAATPAEAAATEAEAEPAEEAPKWLAAAHILVQYQGSMRADPAKITRTKEEALARAKEAIVKVTGGGDFAALAKEYSDGPSGPLGGDLGTFPPRKMIPEFSAALLKGAVGEVVPEPVETAFGYHVILRKEAKTFGARHILVQYKGSMRASAKVTRTKEEAQARADEALAKAKAGGDFAALAKEYSDGPSGPKGGDLGVFPGGTMHPDFQKGVESVAADALVPNLVETPFGYHLIFRTE